MRLRQRQKIQEVLRPVIFKRYSLSLTTSFLIFLSFPKANLWFCSWIGLIPLLQAIDGTKPKYAFGLGLLAGTVAYSGILYWICPTFIAAGLSPWLGGMACLSLSLYLGFYWGLFGWIYTRFQKQFQGSFFALLCATLWVALEYLRSTIFTGFPWELLGTSLWKIPAFIQISEWTGIYGVSFFIVLLNLNLFLLFKKKFNLFPWLLLGTILGLNLFLFARYSEKNENKKSILILQGNIDQYKKWSEEFVRDILTSYETLVSNRQGTFDLIVWPESALPGWYPNEKPLAAWLSKIVRESNTFHLVGAVSQVEGHNYNSAFLLDPKGTIQGHSDKTHLVPFGEYVPQISLLAKIVSYLNQLGNFEEGKPSQMVQIPGVTLGVSICYEAIFPELIRKQVQQGASLLVNITNDGWYLDTAAPAQHFSMNVFRAVENRRFLLRCANTGISGVIDPLGRIQVQSSLNTRTSLRGEIVPLHKKTFYSKHGDAFAMACSSLTLTAILLSLIRKKTNENA